MRVTLPTVSRANQSKSNFLLIALFVTILVILVFISPSQPTHPTVLNVDEQGNVIPPALHITEVMSHNHTTLPDEEGLFSNWIELTNEGDTLLKLENFGLTNRGNRLKFIFPRGAVLNPGERVIVFASNRPQAEIGKPYHANFGITTAERTLFLFSPTGSPVEYVTVPELAPDQAYAKTPGGWVITDFPTPGYENTLAGYLAFLSAVCLEPGVLLLKEIITSIHGWLIDYVALCERSMQTEHFN